MLSPANSRNDLLKKRWFTRIAYFSLGIVTGSVLTFSSISLHNSPLAALSSPSEPVQILDVGSTPPVQGPFMLTKEGYTVCYNGATKQPLWVHEHLTPKSLSGPAKRVNRFFQDNTLPRPVRSNLGDYKGSGLDRGHIAAAGNHKTSQQEMDETFLLSNISPQVGRGFNRGKWRELEEEIRRIARQNEFTDVITGPLFLAQNHKVSYKVIGSSEVAVPTNFFKVVLSKSPKGQTEARGFIIPNEAVPDSKPLAAFEEPMDRIERAAGLIFRR